MNDILQQLAGVLEERKGADPDSSYVANLYDKGLDAILKKVGEEATETVMAAWLVPNPLVLYISMTESI